MNILDEVEQSALRPMNEFDCKCGVVLRTRKVKTTIVRDAWKRLEKPRVPTVYIEELERSEENPADPDYLEAKQDYLLAQAEISTNVYLMFGCDPKFIPPEVPRPDDDSWIDDLEEVQLDIPRAGRARYVAWLKYVVFDDAQEMAECQKAIMRMSGLVLEEDVKKEEDSFPNQ